MLKAVISKDEFGALSEQEQAHFKEKNGLYFVEIEGAEGLELTNPTSLKTALQKERQTAADAGRKAKSLEDTYKDIDAKAAREALAKVKELADYDPDKKLAEAKAQFEVQVTDKYEKELSSIKKKLSSEIEVRDNKLLKREKQLREALVETQVSKILAEKDIEGNPHLLLPVIEQHVVMKDLDDGTFIPEIIGSDGQPLISTDPKSTNPMSLREFVLVLKDKAEYASAFKGSGASGGGAAGSEGQRTTPGGKKTIKSTDQQAINSNLEAIAKGEIIVVD